MGKVRTGLTAHGLKQIDGRDFMAEYIKRWFKIRVRGLIFKLLSVVKCKLYPACERIIHQIHCASFT